MKMLRQAEGFTRRELLVVGSVLAGLFIIMLAIHNNRRARDQRLNCASTLKSIGLGLRMWANDHQENFPWQVSTSEGGTLEYAASPDVWRHFQAVSNELNSPKILVCAADRERMPASDWRRIGNTNLSYFLSLDANESMPSSLLAGDRFISTNNQPFSGLLVTTDWQRLRALPGRHGNVVMSDGSVMQLPTAGLHEAFSNDAVRLAIP
jgi:hypothetical protein